MIKKYRFLYKIIGISFLAFFALNKIFFHSNGILENISSAISYPILVSISKIAIPLRNYLNSRKTLSELQIELEKLSLEKEKLLSENIQLQASLHHRGITDELNEFQKRYELKNSIFTKILIKNIDHSEHYYIINKGSKDGVTKNMVLIYKFQLIGRVSDVYSYHSKVILVTDSKSKIAAYTNSTDARGIIEGNNNANKCKFSYVNHLSTIEDNDFVLSSGQGLIFPEGFCLGKILKHEILGFVHNAEIEPLIDLTTLEFGLLIDRSQIINF